MKGVNSCTLTQALNRRHGPLSQESECYEYDVIYHDFKLLNLVPLRSKISIQRRPKFVASAELKYTFGKHY